MKKNNSNGISALKLAFIITCSIIAAAGIVLLIAKFINKKKIKDALDGCCCDCDCGCDDEWFDGDEDYLGDLRCDDDEENCCDANDDIAAAVDEAIEAIEAVTEE